MTKHRHSDIVIYPLMIALLILASPVRAAESIQDHLLSAWQGEWAWGGVIKKADQSSKAGGNLSIYDCREKSCSFNLPSSGDSSGVCSLDGTLHIQSADTATAEGPSTPGAKICHLKLSLKADKLDIDEGDGCNDYCGPGGSWGTDYKKHSSTHHE